MSREQIKAAHYIQQLDEARCNGEWERIPELIRKIKKHAPQRTCLVITAGCECTVNHLSQSMSSSADSKTTSNLPQQITLLSEAADNERVYMEDAFQARVCLGWIHWQLGDFLSVASMLPGGIEQEFPQLDDVMKDTAQWTRVCGLKASYMKGSSQQRSGAVAEALQTFNSTLPLLYSDTTAQSGKESRHWTELYLTRFCLASSRDAELGAATLDIQTLSAFRAWGKFWAGQSRRPTGGISLGAEVSRRHVWREYYASLSHLLQARLPLLPTSVATAYPEMSAKLQQRVELKNVESCYEALLLEEVQFPRADEATYEVEEFVDTAVKNWRILRGTDWQDHELGEGGTAALSRSVLDILYKASTRTFHSTAILRHLFAVHASVAEFDLAFKAFDTYIEIVRKAKARFEKTGETDQSLDDDNTILITASECIRALCRYGSRREASKALEVAQYFETWVEHHQASEKHHANDQEAEASNHVARVAPETIALTWRYIGIAYAQWARYTHEAAARSGVQLRGIACLRRSLLPQYNGSTCPETVFALGILLAERRDITGAIEIVKSGLLKSPTKSSTNAHHVGYAKERLLIPLWHLMSLLLSARHELVTAARSIEGAFEQFLDPRILFGESDLSGSSPSPQLDKSLTDQGHGIVDDMDDLEKEGVLQVKMTQLCLIEISEGSDMAVNSSDELLSLYTRLYGALQSESVIPDANTATPPKSSAGTIKSLKGSIFGRRGRSSRTSNTGVSAYHGTTATLTRTQTTTRAPAIRITGESELAEKQRPLTRDVSHPNNDKLQSRPRSASGKEKANGNTRARSTSAERVERSAAIDVAPRHDDSKDTQYVAAKGNEHDRADIFDNGRVPGKTSSDLITSKVSLKTTQITVTEFPQEQQKRQRISVLIKVWLLISAFYRRARMYEDAKGAIKEARSLMIAMDAGPLLDYKSNGTCFELRCGGATSTAKLQGDIDSENGFLSLAEDAPFEALGHFESALACYGDHPTAIVGLSNLLLDIYAEELYLPASVPDIVFPAPTSVVSSSTATIPLNSASTSLPNNHRCSVSPTLNSPGPLGIPPVSPSSTMSQTLPNVTLSSCYLSSRLQPSHKKSSTALLDRLAARDRAHGLLSTLTRLGTGWNYSEAWFALARAYEAGNQLEKAGEVLWWCVELEEGKSIRNWDVVGNGGYVL